MSLVARLRALDADQRRALRAAPLWLIRARLLHARLPAPGILRRLRAPAPPARAGAAPPPPPAAMRRALAAWSRRFPWRSDCMIQALAARLWLERAGIAPQVRLGARRGVDGALLAHIWLTVDGEVVTGGALEGRDLAEFAPPRDGSRPDG